MPPEQSSDASDCVRIPPPAHQQTSPITPVFHNVNKILCITYH